VRLSSPREGGLPDAMNMAWTGGQPAREGAHPLDPQAEQRQS
jgi:hypothetical protein